MLGQVVVESSRKGVYGFGAAVSPPKSATIFHLENRP
jgi:hypothetical protein